MTESAAEVANKCCETQSTTLSLIGDGLGVASNIFGVIGGPAAVLSLVSLVKGQDHAIEDKLNEMEHLIESSFSTVIAIDRVQELLTKIHNVAAAANPATKVLQQLDINLGLNPPLNPAERQQQIGFCLDALNALKDDDSLWKVDYLTGLFYENPFTGKLAARPDGDNLIPSFRYILPTYARTLMIFITAGASLDPQFLNNYANSLREYTASLKDAYDASVAGIVPIREPNNGETYRVVPNLQSLYRYTYDTYYDGQHSWLSSAWSDSGQPCGAVDLYGGYIDAKSFPPLAIPQTNWPIPAPTDPDPSVVRPVDSFFKTLRASVHVVQQVGKFAVYENLGLAAVRKIINTLRSLIGDPPIPMPLDTSGLSLAGLRGELDGIFGPARSLRQVLNGLAVMAGVEKPTGQSLRNILNAIPDAKFTSSVL